MKLKKGRRYDPTRCEHPNEVPAVCPCKPGCYCHHGRSCDPRGTARRAPGAGNAGRGSQWIKKSVRERIYARDNHECVWCGSGEVKMMCHCGTELSRGLTLDHVIPRADGGTDHHTNLVTSCSRCNSTRGKRSATEWIAALNPTRIDHRGRIAHWVLSRLCAPLPESRRDQKSRAA